MKGKPIEPGCLALVVRALDKYNNGAVVRVLRRAEPLYSPPGAPPGATPPVGERLQHVIWVTQTPDGAKRLRQQFKHRKTGHILNVYCNERAFRDDRMIRIDDDELQDDTTTTNEKELTS